MKLKSFYQKLKPEAGCDEAGRGCLAGPVVAAAVIFPPKFFHSLINDSKKMSRQQRDEAAEIIKKKSIAWSIGVCSVEEIDEINILNASIRAMHKALYALKVPPAFIIVDGNRFHPYKNLQHKTHVKGDGKFLSIAAASILAKTYRDELMEKLHEDFPFYKWNSNKGYPTIAHRYAIRQYGATEHHRKTFNLLGLAKQGELEFQRAWL